MSQAKANPATIVERSEESTARKANLAPMRSKNKLGVWFFLGGEVILFSTLILTYALIRITNAGEYAAFRSHLSIPLIAANTLVLIISSYFVVRSLQAARQGRPESVFTNLLVVIALGTLFILGQAFEWSTLFGAGVGLSNTFGSPFYVLTGVHGSHVLIGIAWACIVLFLGINRPYNPRHYRALEIFGLYWHFVDIVWIVLFFLIYLL